MSIDDGRGMIFVFAGPTIESSAVTAELPDVVVLPPAAQGDVYRVVQNRPRAIAVIDGYFERIPAIWHKEILWALSQGVPVYGASSMGALRAAELAAFGMVGVGWIYDQFAAGALTDDDEVAIIHASAEDDYRAGSEAMVNIRRTLAAAERDDVISAQDAAVLVGATKDRFYPERCWPQVVQDARRYCSADTAARLRSWLPAGRIDQKRLDAVSLLRTLAATNPGPVDVAWSFNHTVYFDDLVSNAVLDIKSSRSHGLAGHSAVAAEAVLDELRLDYPAYLSALRAALLRTMATLLADQLGLNPDDATLQALMQRHLTALDIEDNEEHANWMSLNNMDSGEFARLAAIEGRFQMVAGTLAAQTFAALMDHLKWTGELDRLIAAAKRKDEVLRSAGIETPSFDDAATDESALYSRWFADNEVAAPQNIDSWARDAGYVDVHAFRRILLRDRVYRRLVGS